MSKKIGRRCIAALVLATTMAAAPAATAAPTATPPPVTGLDCVEYQVWAHGDAKTVAARLPAKYSAYMDNGAPLVFARALHCAHADADGRTDPVTLADYGIVITSPDGYGCSSGLPEVGVENGNSPPVCNWYTLGMVSNDHRVVDLLKQGTPSVPISYVPDLKYQVGQPDSQGVSAFHFAAPTFTIDGTSSLRPGEISLRGAYYFPDGDGRTPKLLVSTDDLAGGHADTVVHGAPGSDVAALIGAGDGASVEPYNEFGVISLGHGFLRKQLLGPALPGETLDSFAGSCSLQGDTTFDPPATNNQQPTTVTYDGKGTCTGTLDGKAVTDAPVTLHHSGRVDASCMHAMSLAPAAGALGFQGGPQLPYTLDFTAKLTEIDGNAYGTRSGIVTGHATFLTQRTSPDVPAQCSGTGIKKAPMDLSLHTDSALVSSSMAAERLSVAVRPKRAAAGRRTRFAFRVRAAGRAVSGAVVRFAGRRVAVRNGRAVVVARLKRPGSYVARVTGAGYGPGRAVVVVAG